MAEPIPFLGEFLPNPCPLSAALAAMPEIIATLSESPAMTMAPWFFRTTFILDVPLTWPDCWRERIVEEDFFNLLLERNLITPQLSAWTEICRAIIMGCDSTLHFRMPTDAVWLAKAPGSTFVHGSLAWYKAVSMDIILAYDDMSPNDQPTLSELVDFGLWELACQLAEQRPHHMQTSVDLIGRDHICPDALLIRLARATYWIHFDDDVFAPETVFEVAVYKGGRDLEHIVRPCKIFALIVMCGAAEPGGELLCASSRMADWPCTARFFAMILRLPMELQVRVIAAIYGRGHFRWRITPALVWWAGAAPLGKPRGASFFVCNGSKK